MFRSNQSFDLSQHDGELSALAAEIGIDWQKARDRICWDDDWKNNLPALDAKRHRQNKDKLYAHLNQKYLGDWKSSYDTVDDTFPYLRAKKLSGINLRLLLNSSFSTAISWILALITDFIALDHFSSAEDPKRKNEDLFSIGIAVLILAGNIFGAYFLFKKEMKIEESLQQNLKTETLETKLSTLKNETAGAEAKYLAKKFPDASDPRACEEGVSSDCGKVFKKASQDEKVAFLSKAGQVKNLEEEISKLKTQSSKTNATSGTFWFHFGYYCLVWLLLFSVIRLEGIRKRRETSS